jgi:hypothetical protein
MLNLGPFKVTFFTTVFKFDSLNMQVVVCMNHLLFPAFIIESSADANKHFKIHVNSISLIKVWSTRTLTYAYLFCIRK